MKLNVYTVDAVAGVTAGVMSRISRPTGGPHVDHTRDRITIGYYGTDYASSLGRNETIELEFTDVEFDRLVESVYAARAGNFAALTHARAQALADGGADVEQA